jgi:hypothetical protein
MPGGELAIPLVLHPSGLWIGISISVGNAYDLLMVVDSGSPVSVVSPAAWKELTSLGLLHATNDPHWFELDALTTQAQILPEMTVRVLPRLTRLQIDGLIGLDYLRRFTKVCFHVTERRLVLE